MDEILWMNSMDGNLNIIIFYNNIIDKKFNQIPN